MLRRSGCRVRVRRKRRRCRRRGRGCGFGRGGRLLRGGLAGKRSCDDFVRVRRLSSFVLRVLGVFPEFLLRLGVGARLTILTTDDLTACGMSDIYPHCCSKRSSIVMCTSIVVSFTNNLFSFLFRHVAKVRHPFEPSQPQAH